MDYLLTSTDILTKKITLIGLDNAGKTSILRNWEHGPSKDPLDPIRPTKLVKTNKMDIKGYKCIIWDFGGQSSFREQYLEKINYYFSYADIIVYVIDIQDPGRYDEAIKYLLDIINVIKIQKLLPKFVIFLHKYDPRLRNSEEINANIDKISQRLKNIFEKEKFNLKMFKTSIYDKITTEIF